MAILIGALEFDGPHADLDSLSNISGVYAAILCVNDEDVEIIDIGDTDFVRECLQNHPERHQWSDHGLEVSFLVHYTADLSTDERRDIKESLERELAGIAA